MRLLLLIQKLYILKPYFKSSP